LLILTWLIWTISKCVIESWIYWLNFWLWHDWFWLSGSELYPLKSTDWIANSDMVDMDSQKVCAQPLNLVLTGLLISTWLIWILRLCVVASRSYQLHWWPWNGWFRLLDCASLPL